MARNPFASIKDEPLTREEVQEFRDRLTRFWEDTRVTTEPNGMFIGTVGNLRAMADHLLAGKKLKK